MKRIVYLIFTLIAAVACKEVFDVPPQSRFKATFINSETNKSAVWEVSVSAIGPDTLLYNKTKVAELLLPLSTSDVTHYKISFGTQDDTLTLKHQKWLQYGSMDSGFYYEYKLENIGFSRNMIDSVEIVDSLVTKTWHENIKLYIRPLPADGN